MNITVEKAEKELQEFLEERPHMQHYQDKIDALLSKTPSKDRMEVLGILTSMKLNEMQKELLKLLKLTYLAMR